MAKKGPYSLSVFNELKEIANSAKIELKLNFGNRKDQQLSYSDIMKKYSI